MSHRHKTGNVRPPVPPPVDMDNRYTVATSGCWIWGGPVTKDGYPSLVFRDGINESAHRYFYRKTHGPIPDGYEVDHLCYQRNCVNPAHLEAVTHDENQRRAVERRRQLRDGAA